MKRLALIGIFLSVQGWAIDENKEILQEQKSDFTKEYLSTIEGQNKIERQQLDAITSEQLSKEHITYLKSIDRNNRR